MESDALASTTAFTSNKKWLNGWFAPKDHLWNHSLYWPTKPYYKCTWKERMYQCLGSLQDRPFFVYHHSIKMHFIFDSKTFQIDNFLFHFVSEIEFDRILFIFITNYMKWYYKIFYMFWYICHYWISQIILKSTAGFLLIFLPSNFFVTLHRMMLP